MSIVSVSAVDAVKGFEVGLGGRYTSGGSVQTIHSKSVYAQ